MPTAFNHLATKAINRVLSDYPRAMEMLIPYATKRIEIELSTGASEIVTLRLRVTNDGLLEPVGDGTNEIASLRFRVPVAALPALARRDEAAYQQLSFEGDSEFAHTLSTIARQARWDVEADLSKLLGDGAFAQVLAHRASSAARTTQLHLDDAATRVTENIAEFLLYESNAFVSREDFDALTRRLEELRDAIGRGEARLHQLQSVQQNTDQPRTEHH